MSCAMAIASVRETDRGSIGGSLEKLCDDGLMKSGSDMSQSHWLRVVECQGWNRAGASRRVRDALCTEYVSARRREHGPGQTGISVCTAAQWAFVLSGVATQPTLPWENWGRRWSGSPTVASAVYEGTTVHWTRPLLAGTAGTQRYVHACTVHYSSDWPGLEYGSGWSWKMKSRDGLNTN